MLKGKGKYILHTDSGREELSDHHTDPAEQHDLAGSTDLTPWRAALAEATGWPVLGGWRLRISELAAPLTLTFSAHYIIQGRVAYVGNDAYSFTNTRVTVAPRPPPVTD